MKYDVRAPTKSGGTVRCRRLICGKKNAERGFTYPGSSRRYYFSCLSQAILTLSNDVKENQRLLACVLESVSIAGTGDSDITCLHRSFLAS